MHKTYEEIRDEVRARTFDEIEVAPWEVHRTPAAAEARRILEEIEPPAGRSDLTIPQKVALADAWASVARAEALEVANAISVLQGGVPTLTEQDDTVAKVPKTEDRRVRRNRLKAIVRKALGL